MFRNSKMLGEQVLHHVRSLSALVNGHSLIAFVPVGYDRARLVGDAGMAAEAECGFNNGVGFRECLVHRADIELALEAKIVTQRRMNHWCPGVQGGFRIGYRGQLFVADINEFTGILGLGARARDDGADSFALPACPLDGNGRLRRRFQPLEMREHTDPWGHHLRDLCPGHDGDNTSRVLCGFCDDFHDACMCMRRTHKSDVRHAREHDIADILSTALCQALQVGSRDRAANIGIGPVKRGEDWRGVVGDFHFLPPARACATASTASTIA